jgi:hypothetical protein
VQEGEEDQAKSVQTTEIVEKGQMRKISMDILLHQFPQTSLVYLSLPLSNISQSSQDSPSPALRTPEELSDTKQPESRPAPTSTLGIQDDTDALLPPPEPMEEAEIQKGTNEFPSAGNGK